MMPIERRNGEPFDETFEGSISWCPASDEKFVNLNLKKCLIEHVSCLVINGRTIGGKPACPYVTVKMSEHELPSRVRNTPGGCPLYGEDPTIVYEWNVTDDLLEHCKKFGHYTAENLAKQDLVSDTNGIVTLPDAFREVVAKQLTKDVELTQRSNDEAMAFDKGYFEKDLVPQFLEDVSFVHKCFHDCSKVSVDLVMTLNDPTTDESTNAAPQTNAPETKNVLVDMTVWCETI